MMIDLTYFVGEVSIPNTDQPAIIERLQWFINKYEPLFLQKFLGYPIYKLTQTNLADARIADIVNGADYIDNAGNLTRWRGLIDTANKESIIANYVYYWFYRSAATQSTGIGEIKYNPDGAIIDNPNQKMAAAWNAINDRVEEFIYFMDRKNNSMPQVYPEFLYLHRYDALATFGFMNTIF